jgi:hypothetical protein
LGIQALQRRAQAGKQHHLARHLASEGAARSEYFVHRRYRLPAEFGEQPDSGLLDKLVFGVGVDGHRNAASDLRLYVCVWRLRNLQVEPTLAVIAQAARIESILEQDRPYTNQSLVSQAVAILVKRIFILGQDNLNGFLVRLRQQLDIIASHGARVTLVSNKVAP